MTPKSHDLLELRRSTEPLVARKIPDLSTGVARLAPARPYWGFWTTPATAQLQRRLGREWQAQIDQEPPVELRVFGQDLDLHWLAGRGVCLSAAETSPAEVGGPGWLERDRRSRLWGEWLEPTDAWYEERIPDPLRYGGLDPNAGNRFAFLRYREYIHRGVLQYVRYLGVEGGEE